MSSTRAKGASSKEPAIGEALRAVWRALAASGIPAMIIGGIAVIARGVPRLTKDIDATIAGGKVDLGKLVELLKGYEIAPRIPNAIEFARESNVLLLRHEPSKIDVDLSLAWLPFELEALGAAEEVRLHGTDVRIPRVDDLVVYKIVGWRPQDRQDIERLVGLHRKIMKLDRVLELARELGEALEDPERVAEFEKLVSSAPHTDGPLARRGPPKARQEGSRGEQPKRQASRPPSKKRGTEK